MKILVDESCPRKLRNDFGPEHEVWTVRDKSWLGIAGLFPELSGQALAGCSPALPASASFSGSTKTAKVKKMKPGVLNRAFCLFDLILALAVLSLSSGLSFSFA